MNDDDGGAADPEPRLPKNASPAEGEGNETGFAQQRAERDGIPLAAGCAEECPVCAEQRRFGPAPAVRVACVDVSVPCVSGARFRRPDVHEGDNIRRPGIGRDGGDDSQKQRQQQ